MALNKISQIHVAVNLDAEIGEQLKKVETNQEYIYLNKRLFNKNVTHSFVYDSTASKSDTKIQHILKTLNCLPFLHLH